MAGSIPLSLVQQFDALGQPLAGGIMYFIQAGTTSTPQNAYQDGGLALAWPNPYHLLDDGRVPLLYFADGYIKVRITDSDGVQVFNQDNIPVTGFSSGGGGGGTIDPTTIIQTGWLQPIYGTGVVTGFVRANGRTIGNASSSGTERANADTSALFTFLYNADTNLAVSGGRGVSASADFGNNKNIALPDFRGRALACLDDMGNTAAGRLTATYFGTAATVLGAAGGTESRTLSLAQLPTGITAVNASQNISVSSQFGGGKVKIPVTEGTIINGTAAASGSATIPVSSAGTWASVSSLSDSNSISVTSNNTSGSAHATASPAMLVTLYLKL